MADVGFPFPNLDMAATKNVDPKAFLSAQRRSVEAMSSASQILADGARTLGQRQAEILQTRMTELAHKSETMFNGEVAKPDVAAGIDAFRTVYEQAIADSRELVEIMTKANADAFQIMSRCMIANIEDMKKFSG